MQIDIHRVAALGALIGQKQAEVDALTEELRALVNGEAATTVTKPKRRATGARCRRQEAIAWVKTQTGRFTIEKAAKGMRISPQAAGKHLNVMAHQGIIKKEQERGKYSVFPEKTTAPTALAAPFGKDPIHVNATRLV